MNWARVLFIQPRLFLTSKPVFKSQNTFNFQSQRYLSLRKLSGAGASKATIGSFSQGAPKAVLLLFAATPQRAFSNFIKNPSTKNGILRDLTLGQYKPSNAFLIESKATPSKRHFGGGRSFGSDLLSNNLLAGLAFTVGVSGAVYFLSPYIFNKTPLRYFKRHPDHLVYLIALLNVAVFGLWRLPQLNSVMEHYFILKNPATSNFHVLQMLASTFSHQEVWHLAMNMLTFASFSTQFAGFLGPANFLTMYLTSGLLGSLFSMAGPTMLKTLGLGSKYYFGSLGASGAVFGVLGCFSWFFPNTQISLFFVPVPGGVWFAFLGSLAFNAAGAVLKWGQFDYMGHLGGSIMGLFWGWYYAQKARQNRKRYF